MVIYCEKKIKAVTQLVTNEDHYYNMTLHSVDDCLSQDAQENGQLTQPVKIAELMELNTFVHHYSERTRQYATQIERLRERSNKLRAEAAQLLHRHPLNEWSTR
jgi:hypothetical protein